MPAVPWLKLGAVQSTGSSIIGQASPVGRGVRHLEQSLAHRARRIERAGVETVLGRAHQRERDPGAAA